MEMGFGIPVLVARCVALMPDLTRDEAIAWVARECELRSEAIEQLKHFVPKPGEKQ